MEISFEQSLRQAIPRVRDLLRRCATTHDHAERAALLGRMADELDKAAMDALEQDHGMGCRCREMAADFRGQAGMARFFADLTRRDHADRISAPAALRA